MRDIIHRTGATELAVARLQTTVVEHETRLGDHEKRHRKMEHIVSKILGACILGSAIGSVLLTKLTGCINP